MGQRLCGIRRGVLERIRLVMAMYSSSDCADYIYQQGTRSVLSCVRRTTFWCEVTLPLSSRLSGSSTPQLLGIQALVLVVAQETSRLNEAQVSVFATQLLLGTYRR